MRLLNQKYRSFDALIKVIEDAPLELVCDELKLILKNEDEKLSFFEKNNFNTLLSNLLKNDINIYDLLMYEQYINKETFNDLFFLSIKKKYFDTFVFIVDKYPEFISEDKTVFTVACNFGNVDVVNYIINSFPHCITAQGFINANKDGNKKIIDLIIPFIDNFTESMFIEENQIESMCTNVQVLKDKENELIEKITLLVEGKSTPEHLKKLNYIIENNLNNSFYEYKGLTTIRGYPPFHLWERKRHWLDLPDVVVIKTNYNDYFIELQINRKKYLINEFISKSVYVMKDGFFLRDVSWVSKTYAEEYLKFLTQIYDEIVAYNVFPT